MNSTPQRSLSRRVLNNKSSIVSINTNSGGFYPYSKETQNRNDLNGQHYYMPQYADLEKTSYSTSPNRIAILNSNVVMSSPSVIPAMQPRLINTSTRHQHHHHQQQQQQQQQQQHHYQYPLQTGSYYNTSQMNNNYYYSNMRNNNSINSNRMKQRNKMMNVTSPRYNQENTANNNKNQKPKKVQYKEIKDVSELFKDATNQDVNSYLLSQYFNKNTKPVDFGEFNHSNEMKSKAIIINTASRSWYKNSNKIQTYKLSTPILSSIKYGSTLSKKIDSHYNDQNISAQPLFIAGNKNFKIDELNEASVELIDKYLSQLDKSSTGRTLIKNSSLNSSKMQRQRRPLINVSNYNDSFDLSFDGKALDRNDIFRMVDSFSIAVSDNESSDIIANSSDISYTQTGNNIHYNNEKDNYTTTNSNNILPAEITSSNVAY
ncbi:hypothetical protein KAFR_0A02880 [Kazachstania africana CBS 2517]|uniref:Uncharacterized protein n=1 Tax=Kazachstania africana (strain ATCC 22294 / BCRC 22015 / CBS 2517 / CECT 1963 / NBRC 1671 / NRRL Y-8276) TaxID=1071382 RepID=H2AMX4_KAZAF|nr:hypothetical protein KAFR_0A02880 [Kazachstania africana CBS 2517]CCF55724.1 hypothetical protein KAFR_0A02880 [Kazachstania africana CBS 2517]